MKSLLLVFLFICVLSQSSLVDSVGSNVRIHENEKGHYGFDVCDLMTVEQLTCLKQSNYSFEFIIPRCYRSIGAIDPNCVQTLKNAKTAGFEYLDVYHFPYLGPEVDAETQIKDSLENLRSNGIKFRRYWLDIELFKYHGWTDNTTYNVLFIEEMVNTLKEAGQTDIGFYASHRCWPPITGNISTYSEYPVWYAHYQVPPQPNFDDFVPYGGWTKPFMKQISGDTKICETSIDIDWTPNTPDT